MTTQQKSVMSVQTQVFTKVFQNEGRSLVQRRDELHIAACKLFYVF